MAVPELESVRLELREAFPDARWRNAQQIRQEEYVEMRDALPLHGGSDFESALALVLDDLVIHHVGSAGANGDMVIFMLDVMGELGRRHRSFKQWIDLFSDSLALPESEQLEIQDGIWRSLPTPPWRDVIPTGYPHAAKMAFRERYFQDFNAAQAAVIARWLTLARTWTRVSNDFRLCAGAIDIATFYWTYRSTHSSKFIVHQD